MSENDKDDCKLLYKVVYPDLWYYNLDFKSLSLLCLLG